MLASRSLSSMLRPSDNSFGVIRLGCAAAVVVSHAMVLATGDRTADPFLAWTGFKIGDHAVNIFFVLSGIVTAASLDRSRSISTFLIARTLRIVPAVAAFALVFGFLIAPFLAVQSAESSLTARETWVFILRTITFAPGNPSLPGVFTNTPIALITNESLWTVKYEIICYLALAVAAAVLSRFGRQALVGGVVAVLAAYVMTIAVAVPTGTVTHLRHFSFCYALGVAAYLAADRLAISGVGVLTTATALVWSIGSVFQPMTTIVFTGYVAIWLASGIEAGPWRAFTTRTDLSYGLYIWGWPVGQILLDGLPGLSWSALAAVNLLLALPFAWLSWHLVERPALTLKRTTVLVSKPDDPHDHVTQPSNIPYAARLRVPRTYARPLGSGW